MVLRLQTVSRTSLALALGCTVLGSLPDVALASEPQMSAWTGQMEDRHPGLISESTGKRLGQMQELVTNEQFEEAIAGLNALLAKVRGNAYEEAVLMEQIAYAYLSKGKADDYRTAIPLFEKVLNSKQLSVPQENSMVYNLAQLYAQIENYARTTQLLDQWFKVTPKPPASALILMANAYAAQEKWQESLPWVNRAIAANEKPQESWYKLKLAIQYSLKDYNACAETLETIIGYWPDNKKYWDQLTGMYLELDQDTKALAVMGVAQQRGFLTDEKQILNLARLYILNDAPFEGGRLLDAAMQNKIVAPTEKNYALLAEAWVQAKEWAKATDALGKGGELSADGELFVRKAQIHVDQLQYNDAVKAVDRAMQKGNLKRPGYAYMIQGRAAAETRNYKTAEEAFRKARGYEETKNAAGAWLDYIAELASAR